MNLNYVWKIIAAIHQEKMTALRCEEDTVN